MSTPNIGIPGAAELLEALDPETRERILSEIRTQQPELALKLLQEIHSFEKLIRLEDAELRQLLQEIPRQRWAIALRATPESLKEKIFANLSTRARGEWEEEIRNVGPQPLNEVRRVQQEIAQIAHRKFPATPKKLD